MWLVCTPSDVEALEAINAQHEDRRIEPIVDDSGRTVVSDDAVGDAYWADWQEWLAGLTPAG